MCKHFGPRSSSTSVGSRLCPNYLWECFVVSAKVVATYSMGVVLVLRSGFGRFSSYTHLVCFKAYLSDIESQPLIFIMMMPSYQMLAFDHAYISQWYSQGSGESEHMRRRARTFATRLHKIWMQMNTQTLTNLV